MRGSIKHRTYKNKQGELVENSSWSIRIDEGKDPITGKRVQRSFTVKKGTHKDAERELRDLLHSLDVGSYVKPAKVTVADYLSRWLQEYAKPNLTSRSYDRYESIVRVHITPSIGSLPLSELRPESLQSLYTQKLNSGLQPASVRYCHVVMHKALNTALQWGLAARNVADAVSPPRSRRADMQIWNESEIAQFLEAAKKSAYYALYYTALYTGARRGELLALTWNDVDFIYSQVAIKRSLHYLKGDKFIFAEPKTEHSRRTIAMSPSLVKVLTEHRQWQESLFGGVADSALVFCTYQGKPLRPGTVSRAWENTAKRAGIKGDTLPRCQAYPRFPYAETRRQSEGSAGAART